MCRSGEQGSGGRRGRILDEEEVWSCASSSAGGFLAEKVLDARMNKIVGEQTYFERF